LILAAGPGYVVNGHRIAASRNGRRFTSSDTPPVTRSLAGSSRFHPGQRGAGQGVASATSGRDVRPSCGRAGTLPRRQAMVPPGRDLRHWPVPGGGTRLDLPQEESRAVIPMIEVTAEALA